MSGHNMNQSVVEKLLSFVKLEFPQKAYKAAY